MIWSKQDWKGFQSHRLYNTLQILQIYNNWTFNDCPMTTWLLLNNCLIHGLIRLSAAASSLKISWQFRYKSCLQTFIKISTAMWAILTCPPNMHRSFVSRTMSLYQDWDSVCTAYKHYKASHVARLAHYIY